MPAAWWRAPTESDRVQIWAAVAGGALLMHTSGCPVAALLSHLYAAKYKPHTALDVGEASGSCAIIIAPEEAPVESL